MPQDTTIYWNGKGATPEAIDTLPELEKNTILIFVKEQKKKPEFSDPTGTYVIIVLFIFLFSCAAIYSNYRTKKRKQTEQDNFLYEPEPAIFPTQPACLTYYGDSLNFSYDIYISVLKKRLPFFNTLDIHGQEKFIERLQKFIEIKTFIIHDESGFREMPILISAAAIQLSFGFQHYLLPDFPYINIYPEEFIGVHPTIRYLEGNVSGNTINISWKHFLNGFQIPNDGQNVGLHEMAHAYHFQNFETSTYEDKDFVDNFPKYNTYANKAFSQESFPGYNLYSDYALRNFQEFWAESVEIFFEKPAEMAATYPDLYIAMCDLMNQHPC